jgi:hypothetical protein
MTPGDFGVDCGDPTCPVCHVEARTRIAVADVSDNHRPFVSNIPSRCGSPGAEPMVDGYNLSSLN